MSLEHLRLALKSERWYDGPISLSSERKAKPSTPRDVRRSQLASEIEERVAERVGPMRNVKDEAA